MVPNKKEDEFNLGTSQRSDKKKRILFSSPEKTRYVRLYPTVYNQALYLRAGLLVNGVKVIPFCDHI